MKKILVGILLCISVCLTLVGCGKTADVQLGLQMTSQMDELVKSDDYWELLGAPPSENGARKNFIANDYDTPIKVYSISVPDPYTIFSKMDRYDEAVWNAVSDNIKEQILNRCTIQTVFNDINFRNASHDELIVITSYIVNKQFNNCSLKEDITYLYIFETGKPIAVTFTEENNTVYAVANFLLVPQSSTLSELREIFNEYGCSVNVEK